MSFKGRKRYRKRRRSGAGCCVIAILLGSIAAVAVAQDYRYDGRFLPLNRRFSSVDDYRGYFNARLRVNRAACAPRGPDIFRQRSDHELLWIRSGFAARQWRRWEVR